MEKQNNEIQNLTAESWKKRFYCMTVALGISLLTLVACVGAFVGVKNSTSVDDSTKLAVFDELAQSFVHELEIDTEHNTSSRMLGYGVSENGDFYIDFEYALILDHDYSDWRKGRVYFWTDERDGHYTYGMSYDE